MNCQLWRFFDSIATETPALHGEPGLLDAICVEHTTQMTLFRCVVGNPCGHAPSTINRTNGMYWGWTLFRYQPATLRVLSSSTSPVRRAAPSSRSADAPLRSSSAAPTVRRPRAQPWRTGPSHTARSPSQINY